MELTQLNVLSEVPFKVQPPPSAVVSVGELTLPRVTFLSSTSRLVVSIVVVVPLTVRSPPTVTFPEVVRLARVPTEVRLEVTTVLFSSVPLSVPAAAVTVIAPVPSKSTPFIALAVANAVAVAAFPVQDPDEPEVLPVTFPVKFPTKEVAVNAPVFELKVRLETLFASSVPVPAVVNRILQEVSVASVATVMRAAIDAVPVKFPVTFPVNNVEVKFPVEGL